MLGVEDGIEVVGSSYDVLSDEVSPERSLDAVNATLALTRQRLPILNDEKASKQTISNLFAKVI